jgi:uncharacterized protein YbjT (DUF2867 family)
MRDERTVLVVGATGRQGGAVARRLMENGVAVRALTRKPDSAAARELERLGADVRRGDLDDRASILAAARGVTGVFVMTTPFEGGAQAEVRQGIALIDAAKEAGVSHIAYSSVGSADRGTGIPHFESKWQVERHLAESGVPFTVLGPASFFENAVSPWQVPGLQQGVLAVAVPPDRPVQQIAISDIAAFAVHVLERSDEFKDTRIDVASAAVTGAEQAEILSRVTGRDIRYAEQPLEQVRSWSEDLAFMYEWLARAGYAADIEGLRRDYPNLGWHTFEDWAREQDWSVLDATVQQAWG